MNRVAFALALCALFGAGCAFEVPASVDGQVSGRDFAIRDDNPVARPQHDGEQLIVLADEVFGELRLVQIRLPAEEHLALDVPMAVGSGGLEVTATYGALEEEHRSDGVRVLSTSEATTVKGIGGAVTLASLDTVLAGQLDVVLEDGGRLTGSFVIER